MARIFKITAATSADYEAMMWIIKNKIFFPEASSSPALPPSGSASFDYRQFFRFVCLDKLDGMPIVKSRQDWTASEFNSQAVPTADWTGRYNLANAPTVSEMPDDYEDVGGRKLVTSADAFLSYNYLQ